ncbi:MAG: hypothetical protein VX492_05890 [Candidatus Thermoplasmatota archaeon]|nr:hypothetical protein [Candidatus Thermoplasmatota archaeon]
MPDGDLVISVETQSFRVTPQSPVSLQDAVSLCGARSNGAYAVIEHENPRSVIVIEPEGTLLIHGISNSEAATLIAEEILLRMGMAEAGMSVDKGEVLASFSIGRAVMIELAAERFSDAEHDLRLDALRIDAKRHNCTILMFNNGRGIVLGQSSRRVAQMAANYWLSQLAEEGALA